MAIFIARLGTTPVAGHQIAANLVSLLFMMPLALGSATEHAGGAAHRRARPQRRARAWAGTA
ncbi:MAG: MATE family efflux transporter [Comamonadaceae bacterium]|nr:MATE family efflux transporter [Comamonadaceae bacterium]